MFKSLRSVIITFAILGSLVILTGTKYGTPTSTTPSIVDDGITITITSPFDAAGNIEFLRPISMSSIPAAPATSGGGDTTIFGQDGGTCCSEGAAAGGPVQITGGDGGPGDGSTSSASGASVIITGGATGADGGAGQQLGGGVSLIGGAGATSADQGAISYQGRRHLWATSGSSRWEIDISGNFLPIDDSTYDIGSATVRPDEIFVDDLIAEQVTWSAAGSAADLFLKRDGANVLAQRNSTTAQNFRLYRTRTNASNYERLNIGLSGVTFQVVTEGAGTGADRDLNIGTLGSSNLVLLTANLAKWRVLSAGNFVPFANDTYDIGLTSSGVRVLYVATRIEHAGDTDTFIDFKSNVIDFDAGGIELMSLDHSSIDPTGIVFNTSQDIDMDLTWSSDNVSGAFFLDAGAEDAKFRIPQGHGNTAIALGAAAVTFSADTNFVTVTGDGGTNTIATITSGTVGETLSLLFVDALVTITDDDSHAADSVDLSAAFTGADDTTLTLLYDGTSWYELSRSVN